MTRLRSVLVSAACAVGVGLLGGVAAAAAVPTPQAASPATKGLLGPGQQLHSYDQLVAPDGLHTLVMQADGNLVLRAGGLAVWSTHTEGRPGSYAVLQADGNLVLRQGRRALWASETASPHLPGRVGLSVQDDGNLVLYRSGGTATPQVVWQSGTPDSALKQIRVRTGCAATLAPPRQVANAPEGLLTSLVPAGVDPESALVCRYASASAPGGSSLLRATTLEQPAATRLAAALRNLALGFPEGVTACPSGNGSRTILALHYLHRSTDVDIAYETSGCRLLDNGYVVATQLANPPFGIFQSVLSELAPGSN